MIALKPSLLHRAVATAALLLGGSAGLAGAQTVKVRYGVSLIGLPIGSAVLDGTLAPNGYKLDASAKLSGLASILSTSHGAASSTGSLAGGHVSPATYATTAANSTMTRTIRMAMEAGTVTGVDIAPPFDPQRKRVPITDADKRNIVDPLAAFLITVPAGSTPVGPAACDRTVPLFDGAVRFNITLSYVGTRHAKAKGFEGDVAVCSARYVPISGQWEGSKQSQFMADNKNLEVWLAPAGPHLLLPFRISVRTMIGTTVIEADEFEVDGAPHAAAQ